MTPIEQLAKLIADNSKRFSVTINIKPIAAVKLGLLDIEGQDWPYYDLSDANEFVVPPMYRRKGRPMNPVYLCIMDKLKQHGRITIDKEHIKLVKTKFNPINYLVKDGLIYIKD
jgi:hypothetical protein